MTVPERLSALRQEMRAQDLSLYLIPTSDFHGSEYVGDYFKCRSYISGFTGSAGTLLVGLDSAGLWTDGRYFLQAGQQLSGSGITLFKMGEPGVPELMDYIVQQLPQGGRLGFDGRTLDTGFVRKLEQRLAEKGGVLCPELDLAGAVWPDRPSLSCRPAWELDLTYAGERRQDKLTRVRSAMEQAGAQQLLVTALDEIAWLLNIRGDDVECNPVVLSYALVTNSGVELFAQRQVFSDELLQTLAKDGLTLHPYDGIYDALAQLPAGTALWLDSARANYALFHQVAAGVQIIDRMSPLQRMKSIKNPTELENVRQAHLKDGIAVTRFLYWLKNHPHPETLTELSAAEKLAGFRQEQTHYLAPSFTTISAYGPHGAIVHYAPTPETDIPLAAKSFLLVDSGGHYLEGTTDITRTIAMGPLTDQEKAMYTAVLRGNLALGAARFAHGCSGRNLDVLARIPLWEQGLDYNHGTGHGVGYLLNVHEGPNSIRFRASDDPARTDTTLEAGMITSNEPGFYLTDHFGIRLENLTACREDLQNEYGRFMSLEALTLVPFDRDAVEVSLLSQREQDLLNAYHQRVYEALAPHLPQEEAQWLRQVTMPL